MSTFEITNAVALGVTIVLNGFLSSGYYRESVSQVSDKYKTVFTPSKYTFIIWVVIYGFGIGFVVESFLTYPNPRVQSLGWLYLVICLLNILWMILWTSEHVKLSVLVISAILSCLVAAYKMVGVHYFSGETVSDGWWIFVHFSLYTGWLMIATIANFFSLHKFLTQHVNMVGDEIESIMAMVVLIAIAAPTSLVLYYFNDFAFVAVVVWAAVGIVVENHTNEKIITGAFYTGSILLGMVVWRIVAVNL